MCKKEGGIMEKDLWPRITVVTNRKLSVRPFLEQIESLCKKRPERILLREKDLEQEAYTRLAGKVKEICDRYQVPFYCHTYREAAVKTEAAGLHLPLPVLRSTGTEDLGKIAVGCSVHSVQEAEEAAALGADYLIAGHIYATECKKDLPPRGVKFLKEVCQAVSLPVYAIGGIRLDQVQIEKTLAVGAMGVCIMSEAMTCEP
ncbi:MAG TPA: thiamine phosphate synthase [Candidatus Blautia intestinavium]|nr:thiamine phosphate synthase [Candidatus Blautia intestinavium]HJB87801.1 thiamine phosphate synthase [Candidatus Blautia excrementigallinarum]